MGSMSYMVLYAVPIPNLPLSDWAATIFFDSLFSA